MKLSNAADEILETLWVSQKEKKLSYVDYDKIQDDNRESALEELKKTGYIKVEDGRIKLMSAGRDPARAAVRRHRLAECLMIDVIGMSRKEGNASACEFEHILEPGMEEKICTLLGHPRRCPHGNPIPQGKCCKNPELQKMPLINKLSEMKTGQKGKVAYLRTTNSSKLQKMMILGILPGAKIKLMINKPSFVFQVGNTQIAVDREIADDIFVLADQ